MNKATIGAILFALSCWAFPIQTAAQTYAQRSPQTVSEIHDQAGAITAQANPSEREEESKETKEVTPPTNEQSRLGKPISKPVSRVDSGRNIPAPETSGLRHYSKEEVQQLIKDYSLQYGINPAIPLCIAKAESGYNHLAKNKSSSASGVFQYLASSTWKGTDEGKAGLSVFDAEANVKAAIKYMSSRRSTAPWEVRNMCPKF